MVTAPFGLSNDGPKSDDPESDDPESADKVGIFPVESAGSHEVIAGFNDWHLDFRVAVISNAGRVHLATWVHPHNFGGRVYLAGILPFHILIARNALKRVAQASTNQS
ncbi:MAG: hypothetical protein ACI9BH_002517 [Paracoccaceae bacterium]